MRRECCSFSNGEYVKQGLDELESWCTQAKPEVNERGGKIVLNFENMSS